MTNRISHARLTLAAIDLETAPDRYAADMLAGQSDTNRRNVATHMISAAGWLVMTEDANGIWRVDELDSLGSATEEFDILLALNRVLRVVLDHGGEVVTYNGQRHDMPVIRRRAARHWMFEMDGLFPPTPIRHADVMRIAGLGIGDWPKLREACAGLGFSCDAEQDPIGAGRKLTPRRRKAEVDAVAAMIIRLHDLAAERRDNATLARAWSALAEHIRRNAANRPHLIQFATSPELEAAANRYL